MKSPPELWAECSEAANLARHLGQFGEIRITRLEPENAVAWEGTLASGTVRLEPSGWGTKVILTAQQLEAPVVEAPEATVEPEAEEPGPDGVAPEPEPVAPESEPIALEPEPVVPEPVLQEPVAPPPPTRRSGGLLARLFGRFRTPQAPPVAPPAPAPAPAPPAPAPVAIEPEPITPEPEPVAPELEPEPVALKSEPEAVVVAEIDPEAVLIAALDSLGQAHHRPFSRG